LTFCVKRKKPVVIPAGWKRGSIPNESKPKDGCPIKNVGHDGVETDARLQKSGMTEGDRFPIKNVGNNEEEKARFTGRSFVFNRQTFQHEFDVV